MSDDDTFPTAPGVTTVRCRGSMESVFGRVIIEIDRIGAQVFAVLDHSGAAAVAGLHLLPTKVIVFGNPHGGTPLMTERPLLALDLPVKLLLWESAGGGVFLSYNDPAALANRYRLPQNARGPLHAVEVVAAAAQD
jgi:uncharacterized protein (DUF302 family)